jgi:hypothetical protein
MKRNFTGPFWLLLVMGLLMLLSVSWYFGETAGINGFSRLSMWRLLALPALVLVEAGMYWLIRRRNKFYALSWVHCGIFCLSFILNILFMVLRIMHYSYQTSTNERVGRQIVMQEQIYFFWGLVIVAHLAFAAVLVNCFRKVPALEEKDEGGGNILDDVML